jgi:ribose 1,5-bisphosphokinase PhnN
MATTTKSVNKQIEALSRMNLATLRKVYKTTLGKETASRNRDALRKRLANHLRESRAETRPRDQRLPPADTVLTREHEGKTYRVTVLENGFRYGTKTYGSLSTIAKEITGTVWNGYVFFRRPLKEACS